MLQQVAVLTGKAGEKLSTGLIRLVVEGPFYGRGQRNATKKKRPSASPALPPASRPGTLNSSATITQAWDTSCTGLLLSAFHLTRQRGEGVMGETKDCQGAGKVVAPQHSKFECTTSPKYVYIYTYI